MKIYLFLAYNEFSIKDYRTWLAPFVRLATYFRNRGLNGESIKWHHCGIVEEYENGTTCVYEALARGVVKGGKELLDQYEHVKLIELEIDPRKFSYYLNSQVGMKYDFFLVMFIKLIYQMFGIWLFNYKPKKKHDCATLIAKGLDCKNWERFDPQDFVRIYAGIK